MKNAIYLFPLAFLLNASAMTLLLIGVGLAGRADLAADIAIVQGASLAVYYAFSANARNIILGESSKIPWLLILRSRVLLVIPLGVVAVLISVYLADVAPTLALVLVLRRCSEWISEVYLARMERERRYDVALRFVAVQSLLLGMAMAGLVVDVGIADLGLLLWALLPFLLSGRFLMMHFRVGNLLDPGWMHMLPHFGSTAITGITVFVFRLVVLLLVGKAYAGNLFTAFAIGGILGSVFAQALGPTLVFHAKEGLVSDIPGWLKACLVGSAGAGTALVLASVADWRVLAETGRPAVFWIAVGASLIGGAVMVLAQRFRLRLLQHHESGDAFGPDVLTNIFIVACVPYVYYLLGVDALSWLFFLNAVIAVVFYAGADRTAASGSKSTNVASPILKQAIAAGLLLPVFFQMTGRIFSDKAPMLDSGGDLLQLPIPISVIVCYGAIVILASYSRARESLSVVFLCFCLMILSAVLSTQHDAGLQQAKIILLIQFILPMLALILGQIYAGALDAERNIARAWLYVAAIVIPLQVVATWLQELPYLAWYLYSFSVYQHLQYVPVVLICAYVLACFTLWQNITHRVVLIALAIPIGAYATLSLSVLSAGALIFGTITFVAYRYLHNWGSDKTAPFVLILLMASGGYLATEMVDHILKKEAVYYVGDNEIGRYKVGDYNTYFEMVEGMRGGNIQAVNDTAPVGQKRFADRLEIWRFYIHEISGGIGELAFGHQSPPDRKRYPSAHNYYLDFVYNFGTLALMPILWLIAVTVWKSGRYWKEILAREDLFALTGVVLFLILIDNSFKVGLRQPYTAIVTFFLWGVLISRLRSLRKDAETHDLER